jgi:uncharacterized GH25 family protein
MKKITKTEAAKHPCRGVIHFEPLIPANAKVGDTFSLKITRCGKPSTKYQVGCLDPKDGWCCEEHYIPEDEFKKL